MLSANAALAIGKLRKYNTVSDKKTKGEQNRLYMKDKLKLSWELFVIFFKIGSFTFGGGMAMLPLIQNEVVDKRKWVSEDEILDVFAISQSVPGVIAVNSAMFIGRRVGGITGAIFASLGVVLPAFISILLVIAILTGLRDNKYVEKVFGGIRAASAGLILLAAAKLGKSAVKNKKDWIIAIVAFAAIAIFNINAASVIILAGVAGFLTYLWDNRRVS